MVDYNKLYDKFEEKGYKFEFFTYVSAPIVLDPSLDQLRLFGEGYLKKQREDLIKNRYQPEWEYWNTWIDYQQYKF